jgi:phenylalanyl-tRNA synthetase beta chain
MKVGYNWLLEWVEIPVDAAGLAKELTMVGLQLESMQETGGDIVLDFEVTVNRPDCLSLLGLAREAATIFGSDPPRLPELHASGIVRFDGAQGEYPAGEEIPLKIFLQDSAVCPRYCGQIVTGIRVGPSPDWVVRKLESGGIRSINNVVDVTNLVMLELGQPMHAFDYDKLAGGTIVVRKAEHLKLPMIDGKERMLDTSMLAIADAEKEQAVGGVMGGMESEVTEKTRTVLLEAAYFDPASIRITAKKLELSTDASYHFERGVDYEMQAIACRRAALLLQQIAGGTPHAILDVCAKRLEAPEIELRPARIEAILGQKMDPTFIDRTLKCLGFQNTSGNRWRVPSYRVDVSREIDLIEEIARHYGYNRFPDTLPLTTGKLQNDYPTYSLERRAAEFLQAAQIDETYTFAFVNPQSSFKGGEVYNRVINPLSEAATELRTSLIPNLVDAVEYNLRHRNENVRLFEIGRIFLEKTEKTMLGIVILGEYQDLKGVLEGMFPALNYSAPVIRSGEISIGPDRIGEIRQLRVEDRPVQVTEISLTDVIGLQTKDNRYQPIIPFPRVQRDVSFIVSEDIPYSQFEEAFHSLSIENLSSWKLVDRYQGTNTPRGKVSLTFQLIYQSDSRTLTSEEVDASHNRLIDDFARRFSAELRK